MISSTSTMRSAEWPHLWSNRTGVATVILTLMNALAVLARTTRLVLRQCYPPTLPLHQFLLIAFDVFAWLAMQMEPATTPISLNTHISAPLLRGARAMPMWRSVRAAHARTAQHAETRPVAQGSLSGHTNALVCQAMQTACAYTIISASTQQSAA